MRVGSLERDGVRMDPRALAVCSSSEGEFGMRVYSTQYGIMQEIKSLQGTVTYDIIASWL
jgi:hypothetical protein